MNAAWFDRARYGLFIHWGPYSVAGRGEWIMNRERIPLSTYRDRYMKRFYAERFDPAAWAQLAREAGMGYVVLTARHHDGFCLWRTETTKYNATRLGPRQDLVAEYVHAVRSAGLKVGLYYSVADWSHPDYPDAYCRDWPDRWPAARRRRRFVEHYTRQLEELMSQYGPIDLLWYDGCIPQPTGGRRVNERLKQLQPNLLITNRNGEPWDIHCCEQAIRPPKPGVRWEACMTLNESWGYNAGDAHWKTPHQVIRLLTETAASGGNLLLNVGPRADGTVPEKSADVLRRVGTWLRQNGEFLPNSSRSPFTWQLWGRITTRGNCIYLHLLNHPGSELCVADIKNRVVRAWHVATGRAVAFRQQRERLLLRQLPGPQDADDVVTIALEVTGRPQTRSPQTSFWIPG